MAFNVSRTVKTVEKEVLKFPAGLDAIESVVIKGSGVPELPSATTGRRGVYGYVAGTILRKVSGDSQNRYEKYTGSGTIEGILGDTVIVYDNSTAASDTPVDMLKHGCVFDKDKIVDYASYASALATALFTCRFETTTTP